MATCNCDAAEGRHEVAFSFCGYPSGSPNAHIKDCYQSLGALENMLFTTAPLTQDECRGLSRLIGGISKTLEAVHEALGGDD